MSNPSKGRSRSDTAITTSTGFGDSNDVALLERKFRGWNIRRRTSEPTDDVKGPLGLHLLHLSAEPVIDLIFVHGLRGGSIKTWRKGTDPRLFWPQNWLPLEPAFKDVSVHTFGYNADWGDTKDSILNVHDFGRTLLGEMKISPHIRNGGTNPIILIGHSMGGLVIKKAYILARQDAANPEFSNRMKCVFFLATPHRGSDSAQLLNNILKASGALSARQYVTDLEKNSATTQTINDEFRNYADELMLWSFYETTKTSLGLSSTMIVERDSAILGYKHERVQYLNANHREVCKYDDPLDPNYLTVKNALAAAVEELLKTGHASKSDRVRAEVKVLQTYLGIVDKPDDDVATQQDAKIPGTCAWLDQRADFQDWRDVVEDSLGKSMDNKFRCYWISAKPATGKSVLAGHVVTHLQDFKLDCSYYFFHHGKKSSQNLSGLLRSLAYQMGISNSIVRQAIFDLVEDGVSFDKDDERAIWRKLFLNGILMSKIHRPQYWVIDALDECINYSILLPLLTKMEAAFPLRIFITSRANTDMEKQFCHMGPDLIVSDISLDETCKDIELFIQSRIENLPVGSQSERQDLARKILFKSDGCFLWVRLVLQELEKSYSDASIESVLEEMPQEMNSFYQRTALKMSENVREKDLTQAILRWTVGSTRPLKIMELQKALILDIGSTVRCVERSVEGLCGQLAYIDKSGAVQIVHQTARDFLFGDQALDFQIKLGTEHEKMAMACLKFLCDDELKPPKNRRYLAAQKSENSAFCDYACTSFSDHVFAAHSEADTILIALDRFLTTNVLTWIEHIARKGSLYYVTRTAKNLKGYLERRAKYLSPLGSHVSTVDAWATDLIRLVAKFGNTILSDPTSIYFLIPPLCPQDSAIYRQSAKSPDGLVLAGIPNKSWEDCISCIDFNASRATALACGENVFAIGMRSGTITIYNQTTFQPEQIFQHMEPVKVLKFDNSCKRFASCGWKTVRLWDRTGGQLWAQSLSSPCIALAFDAKHLVGVCKNSHVITWSKADGKTMDDHFYRYQEPGDEDGSTSQKAPLAAAFSPNMDLLALGYRGQFVCVWDLLNKEFIGCCFRVDEDGLACGLSVGTVLFNPNPDVSLLAIGYQDGDLAIFEPWSQEVVTVVEGNAFSLASSPDGRTLAAGDSCGTVQVWDFETLTLLYRIKSYDFEVKALAFSGDGLRLIDIRDSRSKIWEPAVLVRKTMEEDVSVSDAAILPAITVGLDYFNEILNITTLVSHPSLPIIFAGKSNGSVALFDALTGKEKGTLYCHPKDVFVTAIAFSGGHLASADAGGNVQVWKLARGAPGMWSAQSQTLATALKQSIKQLLISPNGEFLLISASTSDTVWSLRTGLSIGSREVDAESRDVWKWFSGPGPAAEILLLVDDHIQNYLWESFPAMSTHVPIRFDYGLSIKVEEVEIQSASLEQKSQHLIVDLRKHYGNRTTSALLVVNFPSSSLSSDTVAIDRDFSGLGKLVKYFVGVAGSRLIFVDRNSWLSSVDMVTFTGQQYIRHFFVPHEMVTGNAGVVAVMTAGGDLAFTKEGNLAVVRNGMKFQKIVEITQS